MSAHLFTAGCIVWCPSDCKGRQIGLSWKKLRVWIMLSCLVLFRFMNLYDFIWIYVMFCECVSVILTFHFASKWIHGARFVVWMRPCCPRGRLAVSRCDWNKCKRQNDARLERWNPPDPKFHQVPNLKSFQNKRRCFFFSLSLSPSLYLYLYTYIYIYTNVCVIPKYNVASLTYRQCRACKTHKVGMQRAQPPPLFTFLFSLHELDCTVMICGLLCKTIGGWV